MAAEDGYARAPNATDEFHELIQPLLSDAFGLAFSILRDRQAAEDAVQEAAIKAWRGISSLRQSQSPKPWFLAIVANQSRDFLRRSQRAVWSSLNEIVEPRVEDHADGVSRDLDLERALMRLSPQQRGLLYLRYKVDLPPTEIANVLHWRVGTVKSRLHRTLRQLEADSP